MFWVICSGCGPFIERAGHPSLAATYTRNDEDKKDLCIRAEPCTVAARSSCCWSLFSLIHLLPSSPLPPPPPHSFSLLLLFCPPTPSVAVNTRSVCSVAVHVGGRGSMKPRAAFVSYLPHLFFRCVQSNAGGRYADLSRSYVPAHALHSQLYSDPSPGSQCRIQHLRVFFSSDDATMLQCYGFRGRMTIWKQKSPFLFGYCMDEGRRVEVMKEMTKQTLKKRWRTCVHMPPNMTPAEDRGGMAGWMTHECKRVASLPVLHL